MSLSTFKPVAFGISPVAGANGSLQKVSKVTMMTRQPQTPPLQVKGQEKSAVLQESLSSTSRREILHLAAASVGLSLLLPASAEAGTRNATMRQKIMEKFEELRQKAGLSKPKDEGEEKKPKNESEGKSKVESSTKDEIMEKFEELKQKAGLSKPKDEGEEKKPNNESEGKSKVESSTKDEIMEKFEELKQKAGLSKPKDEGEEKKPKDEIHGKLKVESSTKEVVPKSKDGSQDKVKVENSAEKTKAETKDENKQTITSQEPKAAPVIPALPGIMNGKIVETTLP